MFLAATIKATSIQQQVISSSAFRSPSKETLTVNVQVKDIQYITECIRRTANGGNCNDFVEGVAGSSREICSQVRNVSFPVAISD